jgi:hypothetical protein
MKDLPLRFEYFHRRHDREPMQWCEWNPFHVVYPKVPPDALNNHSMLFPCCQWLCREAYMDEAVKEQFRVSRGGPIQPPTEVRFFKALG